MSELLDAEQESIWNLSEVTSDGRKYLKVPIAPLGKWKHRKYGDVSFTQKDFDDAISNWKMSATGYEPPLYLGHPIATNTVDGAPAAAFLEKLYQEGNVLFGEFEPVDEAVYRDVESGKYRYSSAEIVRNAKSKKDGESIGTLLTAVALTNQPFLTGMPRVEAAKELFSESDDSRISLCFSLTSAKEEPMSEKQPTETVTQQAPTQTLSSQDAERFSDLAKQVETMRAELDKANATLKQQAIAKKVDFVQSLSLSASTKETYCDFIRAGSLSPEQEEKMTEMLVKLSEEYKEKFSEQQGEVEVSATSEQTTEFVNPYADIISRNEELAKKKSSN